MKFNVGRLIGYAAKIESNLLKASNTFSAKPILPFSKEKPLWVDGFSKRDFHASTVLSKIPSLRETLEKNYKQTLSKLLPSVKIDYSHYTYEWEAFSKVLTAGLNERYANFSSSLSRKEIESNYPKLKKASDIFDMLELYMPKIIPIINKVEQFQSLSCLNEMQSNELLNFKKKLDKLLPERILKKDELCKLKPLRGLEFTFGKEIAQELTLFLGKYKLFLDTYQQDIEASLSKSEKSR
jgi:hypothetical protein